MEIGSNPTASPARQFGFYADLRMSARKGRQQQAFANSSSVSTFPPGRLGLADRRKSPAVVANIPIFERPRLETWFDRDCPVRAENLVGFISTSRQMPKQALQLFSTLSTVPTSSCSTGAPMVAMGDARTGASRRCE